MLADPAPGTAEDEELEVLAFLIEGYEVRSIQIPAATPAEAIRFRMEQAGRQNDPIGAFNRQADGFALNALVADQEWDCLNRLYCADEIKAAAKNLSIHPAIISKVWGFRATMRGHKALLTPHSLCCFPLWKVF